MNRRTPFAFIVLLLGAMLVFGQIPSRTMPEKDKQVRLPNGKLQSEEILKSEHGKNLEDVEELIRMSEELKAQLEKNEHHVFSIQTLKLTEEMEKKIKKIRGRLKRY